ncbi:MAG: helix-turn-helix transcriptional regulator [Eisenbergiella porci]|uniref:helix-turn-helix transcriptional regulator n=1 Tax=Eisenbergiella porci TaxID=2652274 RepID=UPI002A75853E|nr:helix-turn-helix transcriptional regulator [Eisenbergiella porci]MDY2655010.1 helix-turn-helix transcriptional regulator [Eisenbergiella porci]
MSQTNTRKYSPLGKQIMKRLVDKNMTAKQLADALGTTPQYLNKILHGERSGEKYMEALRGLLDIVA